MTGAPWQHTEAQQKAIALRAALAAAEQVVARFERDFQVASGYDREFRERRDAIRSAMAQIGPAIGMDGLPRRYQTPSEIDEYRRLGRELSDLEASRQRWISERATTWSDAIGRTQSYVLIPSDTERHLQAARQRRDVAAAALADVEATLSAGELVQTGVQAPEYAEHHQRVEALRQRLG